MRYIVSAIIAVAFGFILSLPASAAGARVNEFDHVFGLVHCSAKGICIVKENDGGVIADFQQAAYAVNRTAMRVVIAGPCYSACTVFADLARTHVCITRDAVFGFHMAAIGGQPDWSDPLPGNSRDIVKWVNAHGGYPTPDRLLMMNYADASTFWKRCST